MPPLRERKEDIPLLARHFLQRVFRTLTAARPKEMRDEAIEVLMRYSWPGNVRELRNVIERIVIMNPTVHGWNANTCRRWSIARAAAAPWASSPACTRRAPLTSAITS